MCKYIVDNIDNLTNDFLINLSDNNCKTIVSINVELSKHTIDLLSKLNRYRNIAIEYNILLNKDNYRNVSQIITKIDYFSYLFDCIKIQIDSQLDSKINRWIKSALKYKKEIDKNLSNKMYLAIVEVVII